MLLNPKNKIYLLHVDGAPHEDILRLCQLTAQPLPPNKSAVGAVARAVVKAVASSCMQIPPQELEFAHYKHGKPYLKGFEEFFFNLSHSGQTAAVAFGNRPLGVDIEVLRRVNLSLAKRYFSAHEQQAVRDSKSFFEIWTAKEAYLKKTGEGLTRQLSTLQVPDADHIKTFCEDGLVLSVCSTDSEKFETVTIHISDVLKLCQSELLEKL